MNDINQIYQKFGKNICLSPFIGAFYQSNDQIPQSQSYVPDSTVRPCCVINDYQKWKVLDNNIENSRNSTIWKSLRQGFLDGRMNEMKDCSQCILNEKTGASSTRIESNRFFAEHLNIDIIKEIDNIVANNNEVVDIKALDYYPSNYCNYSCVMCTGGASSQRLTYEIKMYQSNLKTVINETTEDFFKILDQVNLIKFTGGETVLQSQVHDVVDYLIEKDLAKNVTIMLLTNASLSVAKHMDKFSKFRNIIYGISIDGTDDIIEYQRRGCKWETVEQNALELINHKSISTSINHVLTAINVLNFIDFVAWLHQHQVNQGTSITISPVYWFEHLGQSALPSELKSLALARLYQGRTQYADTWYVKLINQVIGIVEQAEFNPDHHRRFIDYIKKEDSVSARSLATCVPEWTPYFGTYPNTS